MRNTVYPMAVLAVASAALGAEIAWEAPSSGLLLSDGSWAGGMTPDSGDGGLFAVPGSYEVQLGEDAEFGYVAVDGSSPVFQFPGSRFDLAFFGDAPAGVTVGRGAAMSSLTLAIGEVVCDTVVIARDAGSLATLSITGSSSLLDSLFRVDVGLGGNGTLELTSGGVFDGSQVLVGRQNGAEGRVAVDGNGSMLTASFLTIGEQGQGTLDVSGGGFVSLVGLNVGAGQGSGDVTITGSGSEINTNAGDAVIGDGGDATLSLTQGLLRARDIVFANPGSSVVVAGGSGGFAATRDVLIGVGGVAEAVLGASHLTACQRLRIASANGSLASLELDGAVVANTRVDVAPGLFSLGTLRTGPNAQISTPLVRVFTNGTFSGDGRVTGNVEVSGGLEPLGTLDVIGDLTFAGVVGPGTLLFTADAVVNTAVVTGTATLSGTFSLSVADGFAPMTGQSFVALSAGNVVGSFSSMDLPSADWTVEVVGDEVVATFTGTSTQPEDLNGDGIVDSSDLASLLAQWDACPGCPADFDGSGVVDSTDLATLLAVWTPIK